MNPNEYNNMNNGQMPMGSGQAPMGNGPQPNQNPGLGVFANEMDPSSNRLNSQAQGGAWASPQQTGPSNTFGGSMQQMPQQGGPVNTMSGNMGMAQPMQQQPMMQQPMQQMPQQQPMQQQSMQQMPQQQPMQQQPMQQQPMMQQANVQGQGVQNPYQPYPAYQPQKMDLKTTLENNKKILMIAACCFAGFILFIIFINIIATKTLKCTNTESFYGLDYTYSEKAKFKFGKIKSTESLKTIEYSDYKMSTLTKIKYSNRRPKAFYTEMVYEYDDIDDLEDQYKEAKSAKKEGINKYCSKYNVKKSGKKLTISCTVDRDYVGKVSDSAIELITYKEMKENLIDDDYTCK